MMGLSGQTADITVNFKLWNDGTDEQMVQHLTGVFTNDTVVTLTEQMTYIEDYIQASSFSATWEFDHVTGDRYDEREVYFGKFDFPVIKRGSPKWLDCRMGLTVGKSV